MDYGPSDTVPGLEGIHLETPEDHPSVRVFRDVPEVTAGLGEALKYLSSQRINRLVFDMSTTPRERRFFCVAEIEEMALSYRGLRTRYVGMTEEDLQTAEPSWCDKNKYKMEPSIDKAVESFTSN